MKVVKDKADASQKVLEDMAQLLWQASFPEGLQKHHEWLIAFRQSVPVSVRGYWHNIVEKVALRLPSACQVEAITRVSPKTLSALPSDMPDKAVQGSSKQVEVTANGSTTSCTDVVESIESSSCSPADERATRGDDRASSDAATQAWKASTAAFAVSRRRIPWSKNVSPDPSASIADCGDALAGSISNASHNPAAVDSTHLRPPASVWQGGEGPVLPSSEARHSDAEGPQVADIQAAQPLEMETQIDDVQAASHISEVEPLKGDAMQEERYDLAGTSSGEPSAANELQTPEIELVPSADDCRLSCPLDASRQSDSESIELASDSDGAEIARDNAQSQKRFREEEFHETAKRRQLVCVICRDFPSKPQVSAVCGHFGCSDCWTSWLVCRFECPVCRAKVRPSNLIRLQGV
jgi:hypothetical protein